MTYKVKNKNIILLQLLRYICKYCNKTNNLKQSQKNHATQIYNNDEK
ncbi:hypothetical protein RCH18_003129 [Flavobacterium sp. PL11]|nr:hypothetical protein [Flavobacterium sp. PL11]